MSAGTATEPKLDTDRLDGVVDRAQTAARAFRRLDQAAVDKIVWEMTVAGLRAAVELAELAIEETGFGVFEDKVVKNYVATEFLYDYLKDKPSVGVIETDPQRGIEVVAEPIGVVLALLPITNPTSTALFKSIVAAKTRNAIVFRPSARAARCAGRAIELLQEAGERAGLPPDVLQVVPDATLDVSQYLFHHPGSTSSGRLEARRRLPRPTRRQAVRRSVPATRRCTSTAAPTSRWRSPTSSSPRRSTRR